MTTIASDRHLRPAADQGKPPEAATSTYHGRSRGETWTIAAFPVLTCRRWPPVAPARPIGLPAGPGPITRTVAGQGVQTEIDCGGHHGRIGIGSGGHPASWKTGLRSATRCHAYAASPDPTPSRCQSLRAFLCSAIDEPRGAKMAAPSYSHAAGSDIV